MSSDVKHDYHLVDPSPWPLVGSIGAFTMLVGAVFWMNKDYAGFFGMPVAGQPWILPDRPGAGALHHGRLVARRDPRIRRAGQPHPGGEAASALRHAAVHRLGSDVLRRLVLGLFQHRHLPQRCRRLQLAAGGHRHPRSLALPAAQHPDPADLGHDGDLGASRHPDRRPQGRDAGPGADRAAGLSFTCVQAYEYAHAPFTFGFNNLALVPFTDPAHMRRWRRARAISTRSTARPSSWPPASTASTSSSAPSS